MGSTDTLFEGDVFPLPEWDTIAGIVRDAKAADAVILDDALARHPMTADLKRAGF